MNSSSSSASHYIEVRPENTDDVLSNPDMGLVFFHYSNRQWAYGALQERGDVLDWFPGVTTAYFRLPWCLLEPREGEFRWDLIDTYAAPWIAAGKQIGLRVTCCESRYPFATPEWVRRAGARGWFFKIRMDKIFGKYPPGGDTDLWEPDYGDPVFLEKLEHFLSAMARRYDGNPAVAFLDVGSIGMWGEGHTRAYGEAMKAEGHDPEEAIRLHYELHRRLFPRTMVLCNDDHAGSSLQTPAEQVPLMRRAHELGFGFRDDSILVFTPEMIPDEKKHLRAHPQWFHAHWGRYFAPDAPVFVEHEHYGLSTARGAWSDEKLVESVEAYRATWLSVHGWPRECLERSGDAYARAARRLGYRFELREAAHPDRARIGAPIEIRSTWVNVGVARRYRGAFLAWSLVDDRGRVAWTCVDESFDFAEAEPTLDGIEKPVKRVSRCTFGFDGEIPRINDGVLVHVETFGPAEIAANPRVPTIAPGEYALCVSLGDRDGTPRLALPLRGAANRRHPIGRIRLVV